MPEFISNVPGDSALEGQNYAGNIIVNLASLPDFLRRPMLRRRLLEFFGMSEAEKDEIICNALEAGPTIPFPNFARLFQTWLEVLCTLSEDQRRQIFARYTDAAAKDPQALIRFNLDGILEIYGMLKPGERDTIAGTVRDIVAGLDPGAKRRILLIIPDSARTRLGV